MSVLLRSFLIVLVLVAYVVLLAYLANHLLFVVLFAAWGQ